MASIFDEECLIPPLRADLIFPNPRYAADEGLLAFGGDLSPSRLLTAYRRGIFPWYSIDDPILWWSPNPRMILYPNDFKMSKSFKRVLKNGGFRVSFDQAFEDVIRHCGTVPRDGQNGSWLIDEMRDAYIELHRMGFAHSVEVYLDDELVGGLYGIAIGKAFFGESMFSLRSNTSKVAFKALSDTLILRGYDLIDCQVKNDHLVSMGAIEIPRDRFLKELEEALAKSTDLGSWREWKWSQDKLQ